MSGLPHAVCKADKRSCGLGPIPCWERAVRSSYTRAQMTSLREQLATVANDEANLLPSMIAIAPAVVDVAKGLTGALADMKEH